MYKEIWKDIEGFEGIYQISNLGKLKNIKKNRIKKPWINNAGYYATFLSVGGKRKHFLIHRLIAIAFIPNPNNYPCINHKDETRCNNKIENLEWCTYKYNTNYGSAIQRKIESTEKPVIQKTKHGEVIKTYKSRKEASKETGIDDSSICGCVNGSHKTAGGFIWERA